MDTVFIVLWLVGMASFIFSLIVALISKLRGRRVRVFLRNAAISFIASVVAFLSFGYTTYLSTPGVASETAVEDGRAEPERTNSEETLAFAEELVELVPFSKEGLYEQLVVDGYSEDAARNAVNQIDVDFQENALQYANDFLGTSGFSELGLRDQLDYLGFTPDQIDYAINHIEADWNEEARLSALSYLEHTSLSGEELYEQLIYEGFTEGQAAYAMEQVAE